MSRDWQACNVYACQTKAVGNGLFMKHYKRMKRYGTVELTRNGKYTTCSTEGCTNKPNGHGICVSCRDRKRKALGLCYRCGKSNDGGSYCNECREKINISRRKRREKRGMEVMG